MEMCHSGVDTFAISRPCARALASHADVLRGSSRVPAPRTSADLSGEKRKPITADFQIWEVHFGP